MFVFLPVPTAPFGDLSHRLFRTAPELHIRACCMYLLDHETALLLPTYVLHEQTADCGGERDSGIVVEVRTHCKSSEERRKNDTGRYEPPFLHSIPYSCLRLGPSRFHPIFYFMYNVVLPRVAFPSPAYFVPYFQPMNLPFLSVRAPS